ncbi:MAG TPA: T9SS type A sorting domain-containing protein [Fluviicola sp.]|nr:T9SS type A sorting domain-containing protein [Fluviicola sp.]
MKQLIRIGLLSAVVHFSAYAQLPNGSTAPNFTLTDIDGTTHDLYSYLDAGKTVYLDFFAAHCPTCWAYKNSGAMEGLYTNYGPNGTVHQDIVILAIELDQNNGANELNGISGFTQGDWVSAFPYPIINPEGADYSAIVNAYAANYYPLIYGICPDRRIKVLGPVPTASLYDYYTDDCMSLGIETGMMEKLPFHHDVENQIIYLEQPGDLEITDLNGKVVCKQTKENPGITISTASFPTGLYVVRFNGETLQTVSKIVVQ